MSARRVPRGRAAIWCTCAGVAVGLAGCGSAAEPTAGSGTSHQAAASTAGSSSAAPPHTQASAGTSMSTPANTPAATSCQVSGLRITLDDAASGVTAGSSLLPIEFTNTSAVSCTMSGYPAVSFTTGASGTQIGAAAVPDRAVKAVSVLLSPGGQAHAWLQVLSAGNYPAAKCRPATAAGLRIDLPGAAAPNFIRHQFAACAAEVQGTELLVVQPITVGQAERGTAP